MSEEEQGLCSKDCFWYEDGECEAMGLYEEVRGRKSPCLYPNQKDRHYTTSVTSIGALCATLEGKVVQGGPCDNTELVKMLTRK